MNEAALFRAYGVPPADVVPAPGWSLVDAELVDEDLVAPADDLPWFPGAAELVALRARLSIADALELDD
jgi:hypothetical protein